MGLFKVSVHYVVAAVEFYAGLFCILMGISLFMFSMIGDMSGEGYMVMRVLRPVGVVEELMGLAIFSAPAACGMLIGIQFMQNSTRRMRWLWLSRGMYR